MHPRFFLIIAALLLSFSAQSFGQTSPAQTPPTTEPFPVPSTFTATLPCADCPAIHESLTLLPNRNYLDVYEYQDRNTSSYALGRWYPIADNTRIILFSGNPPNNYEILDRNHIRKLAPAGSNIPDQYLPTLSRSKTVAIPSGSFTIRGEYVYDPAKGTSRITVCPYRAMLPVSSGGDFASLLNAYGSAHIKNGSPLLISFSGKLAIKPSNQEPFLVVDHFESAWPGKTCISSPDSTEQH